jgi:serine/threonine protein phosphatase PrpC
MPDDVKVICSSCGHKNPETLQFCTNCGRRFNSSPSTKPAVRPPTPSAAPPQKSASILDEVKEGFKEVFGGIKQSLTGSASSASGSPAPNRVAPPKPSQPRRSQSVPTLKLTENDILTASKPRAPVPEGQNIAGQYRNLKTVGLETCTYYEAVALSTLPTGMLRQPSPTHLIRETGPRPLHLSPGDYHVLSSNRQIPFVLPVEQPGPLPERIYTVTPHPGPWGVLAKIKAPQTPEKALTWIGQIAQALSGLNQAGFGGFWPGREGREAIAILRGEAWLADITFAQRVEGNNFAPDVYALASLLYYLLTGYELDAEASQSPPQFRTLLRQAATGTIATIPMFLQELETSKQTPIYSRALRQASGYLTHPGKTREHNEDYVGVFQLAMDQSGSAEPVGLYVVADGMGGQAAGEFASRDSVRQAFVEFINNQVMPQLQKITRRLDTSTADTPQGQLEKLVQTANQLVYRANQATNSDRGTTITAVLVIGSQAHFANVGDSRTYLLRNGELMQVTQDHSLVYSLWQAKQISEEEIYTHPRKNEVHRSIGDRAEVKVDMFNRTLQPGDKLLLCSDGLWEMVRNPHIQQTMTMNATPQAICDQLIRMANDNGGEDNITAVVVAIE